MDSARRTRRHRLLGVAALVGVLLAGGIAAFGVAWSRRGAETASLDDAVERFRAGSGAREAGFLRPATGVYSYTGTGTERLSVLGTRQRWGERLPAIVTRDQDGCWTLAIEYSTNHSQSTTYCPTDSALKEMGGETFQSFDFVAVTARERTVFTCSPPGDAVRITAEPDDAWRQSCRGRSETRGTEVTSSGTNRFLGMVPLRIGGEQVDAYHYRATRVLTGDQTGREDNELWFAARDGLLLRAVRDVRVASPSPLGDIVYTEQGTLALVSLTPRR